MIKKNLFYNSLLSISQFIFPLVTFPYSSRILGPHGLGSVNFIDSFTQYFILFSALGIPLYGVREISRRKGQPDEIKKVFNEILWIHIASTCAFAVAYLALAFAVPELRSHLDIVLVGILIMFANIFLFEWFFQGIGEFSYLATRSVIVRLVTVVFLFLFLKPGSNPIIYYGILASGYVISGVLNLAYAQKYTQIKLTRPNFESHLKPLAIILGSTLAVSVYLLMDTIMLGFIKDEAAVGIYSTAIRIVKIPFTLIVAISTVIIPQVSHAFQQQDFTRIIELIRKSLTFIYIIGVPITAGLFISSSFLVQVFAGNKFSGSILPLQILSPVMVLVGLNNIFAFQLLTPMGKEKYLLRAVLAGMVFSFVLNLYLIPRLSFVGAAITNVITECIVTFLCFLFVRKHIRVVFDVKILCQCICGAALFFPIALLIRGLKYGDIATEIAVIMTCTITYAAYIWIFINNEYLESVKQAIRSRLSLKYFRASLYNFNN